jgi:hypothetical protein
MRRVPQQLSVLTLLLVLLARPGLAQTLSGDALVKALRQGGYVLVMRHASSPRDAPAKDVANPANVKMERQLDDTGRVTATAQSRVSRVDDDGALHSTRTH